MLVTRGDRVLNLEERARLAINCLTRLVDPKRNYQPYFFVAYDEEPVTAWHHLWDYGDACGRITDALAKARLMSGSSQNREVDEKLKALLISLISMEEDGLCWVPDTPWVSKRVEMFSQRSAMIGLLSLYHRERNDFYLSCIKRMIERLWEIAIKKEEYAYYPSFSYYPNGWKIKDEPLENGVAGWAMGAQQVPVLEYYEITKDKAALKLAKNMLNFLLTRVHDFNENGSFDSIPLPVGRDFVFTLRNHFHSRSASILAVLKYGLIIGEPDYVKWAKNAYDHAKKWGSSFGWFPESLDNAERCETCCIDDMIEIAVNLARNGYSQYWDDVEAFGLNHLLESQMLRSEWVNNITSRKKYEKCIGRYCFGAHSTWTYSHECTHQEECFTTEDVIERNIGGFAGWSRPNDYIDMDIPKGMQCCNATGVRGLYALWNNVVIKEKERLFVNLYISRDSKWARIESLFPAANILKVTPYIRAELLIRKPNWMGEEVKFFLNGEPLKANLQNGVFNLGLRKPGDEVLLYTPLVEKTRKEKIGDTEYTTRWIGNVVVNINPRGNIYPLYQRDHLLAD